MIHTLITWRIKILYVKKSLGIVVLKMQKNSPTRYTVYILRDWTEYGKDFIRRLILVTDRVVEFKDDISKGSFNTSYNAFSLSIIKIITPINQPNCIIIHHYFHSNVYCYVKYNVLYYILCIFVNGFIRCIFFREKHLCIINVGQVCMKLMEIYSKM